jgi:hypothetical protein
VTARPESAPERKGARATEPLSAAGHRARKPVATPRAPRRDSFQRRLTTRHKVKGAGPGAQTCLPPKHGRPRIACSRLLGRGTLEAWAFTPK